MQAVPQPIAQTTIRRVIITESITEDLGILSIMTFLSTWIEISGLGKVLEAESGYTISEAKLRRLC